jgi:type IV pilus assembly protein PilW
MRDFYQQLSNQKGFSIIELMVGMALGLMATLVIVQVFSAFEGQKRTTSGSADAQTNGTIALMNIQRNIQMAGYGLPLPMADKENSSLKCTAFANYDPDNNVATNNSTNLFPLIIQDGIGSNGSDVITVRYSTTAMGAVPVKIINASGATGAGINVDNNIGCNDNDIALIMDGNNCQMATIADGNGSPDTDVNIKLTAWAPAGAPLVNNAKIACMGDWQNYTYQLNANDELLLNGEPIVSEVVSLQAQYGISATADSNQVNQWVNATGATWAAPSVANRNRIKAIRVAVILRNGLEEKEVVTTACSSTTAANPTGLCAWDATSAGPLVASPAPAINLNAIGGANYRYRVFETIIPLRNMLWSKEAV